MAVIYLRSSDGSDASDGLTWANAKATLAGALTAAGAGGTVYVSDNHAETQASAMTLTSPGTSASPVTVICVVDTADPEPPTAVATTGTVTTTVGAITFNGYAYAYGLTFNAGTSSTPNILFNSTSAWTWVFEQCVLALKATSASQTITIGSASGTNIAAKLVLRNTNVSFAQVGQSILVNAKLEWFGGSLITTAPTTLFITSTFRGNALVSGVDLSIMGAAKTIVGAITNSSILQFINCKLGASVVTATVTTGNGGAVSEFINCDSGDTNYRYQKNCYQGDITQEATIIRTSGASDGTTGISRKIVTSANSKFYSPLESAPIIKWNETTGSVTATVEVVTDNVTLTNAEAWLEVEYLGTSGFPLSVFASDRAADILATPANQTTSTVAWTTTGLATPVKQKLAVTFTPAEKGLISARVMLAKASTTMYFCPLLDIT